MTARIGVFGIGLAAYWPQFPGMNERLEGYQRAVEDRVRGFGGEVVSAGLVDTPEGARVAGQVFLREDVDLILCTWPPTPPHRRCCRWCRSRRLGCWC